MILLVRSPPTSRDCTDLSKTSKTVQSNSCPCFAARTKLGIWLRNAGMRAMNLPFVGDLVVSRALRDDIDLPDYPL